MFPKLWMIIAQHLRCDSYSQWFLEYTNPQRTETESTRRLYLNISNKEQLYDGHCVESVSRTIWKYSCNNDSFSLFCHTGVMAGHLACVCLVFLSVVWTSTAMFYGPKFQPGFQRLQQIGTRPLTGALHIPLSHCVPTDILPSCCIRVNSMTQLQPRWPWGDAIWHLYY